jgi:hypothetical protein
MNFAPVIKLYLIVSCAVVSVLASPASMVQEGMVLGEALSEAKRLCPEKLVGHNSVKQLKLKIRDLMAPTLSSKDPLRKSYKLQVPGKERVSRRVNKLCGFQENYEVIHEIKPAVEEAENVEENMSIESEANGFLLSDDYSNYRSLFFFFFGMVCGMFSVFAYFSFHNNKAALVNSNKSLRRPEL